MNRDHRRQLNQLNPEQQMMVNRQVFDYYWPYYSGPGQVNRQAYQPAVTPPPQQADWAAFLARLGAHQNPSLTIGGAPMDWLNKPSLMDPRYNSFKEGEEQSDSQTNVRPRQFGVGQANQTRQEQKPPGNSLPTPPHEWFNGFGPVPPGQNRANLNGIPEINQNPSVLHAVGQFNTGFGARYSISRTSDLLPFHHGQTSDPNFWNKKGVQWPKVSPDRVANANEVVTKPPWHNGPDNPWWMEHRFGKNLQKFGVHSYLNEVPPRLIPTKEEAVKLLEGAFEEIKRLNLREVATDAVIGAALAGLLIAATGGAGAVPVLLWRIGGFALKEAASSLIGQFGERVLTGFGMDPQTAKDAVFMMKGASTFRGGAKMVKKTLKKAYDYVPQSNPWVGW